MNERFDARLERHRLIAILRGVPGDHVEDLGRALVEGGVRLLEIALGGPEDVSQIRTLRSALPEDVEVGAGTVTTVALARAAHDAGASFFVTPHVAEAVNAYASKAKLGLVSGALTPTEIAAARTQGSRFVKLFPAAAFGPSYMKALLAPYPDLELIAVGGIGPDNVREYLQAGATGAGVGSSLTSLQWDAPDFSACIAGARALVAATAR